MPMSIFPPNTEEKQKIASEWRSKRGGLEPAGEKLQAVIAAAKEKEQWRDLPWGGYGLCWGAKVGLRESGFLFWGKELLADL